MATKPTYLDRLRSFRLLMGDQKEQLTDEEYDEYLRQSSSLCGRLWANLNSGEEESEASLSSISELYESLTEEELEAVEDQPFSDSTDDILSSTFIVEEDADFSTTFSREEFFDLMEDFGDGGIVLEERIRVAVSRPTTSPCA